MSFTAAQRADVGETGVFGQAMGLVAATLRPDLRHVPRPAPGRKPVDRLLGLILYGFVSLFVPMPGGNVIYALLGLGIFGGYTLLDFNRLRRVGSGDAVSIAAGIFLDTLNVFLFFLQLFGRGQN